MNSEELIAQIKGTDEKARGQAWQAAGSAGAAAVVPLIALANDPTQSISRAATRALWLIVRHAGRPGASSEREAVVKELLVALDDNNRAMTRSELIWMLSEIAGDEAVPLLARLLKDEYTREDARMALQRIEGDASLSALRDAMKTAPPEFQPNLAYSLRRRGVEAPGVPSLRLKPVFSTNVKKGGVASK